MNRAEAIARADTMECKGKCVESCGPIVVTGAELEAIRVYTAEHGLPFHELPYDLSAAELLVKYVHDIQLPDHELQCPYLEHGRCSIYPVRPLICHLWGAEERMPCPWGCQPKGGRFRAPSELVHAP